MENAPCSRSGPWLSQELGWQVARRRERHPPQRNIALVNQGAAVESVAAPEENIAHFKIPRPPWLVGTVRGRRPD